MNYPWSKDIDWKLQSKDKRVYIMRDHNWAFAAWEISKIENRIQEGSIVVHVDSHFDDVPDGLIVKGLFEAKSKEDIMKVSRSYDRSSRQVPESNLMHIDNFIWASVGRETIEEVIFVSRDNLELNDISNVREEYAHCLHSNCKYSSKLFRHSGEFLSSYDKKSFAEYIGNRSAILDLDIDAFNNSDIIGDSDFISEATIREYVKGLNELYSWNLITISISPDYSGGATGASYLLDIVLSELEIGLTDMEKW